MLREGMWVKLVRSLPVGTTELGAINGRQSDSIRATIRRENSIQKERYYTISSEDVYSKGRGRAKITVIER